MKTTVAFFVAVIILAPLGFGQQPAPDCFVLMSPALEAQTRTVVEALIEQKLTPEEAELWLRALIPPQCENNAQNAPALRAAELQRWEAKKASGESTYR